MSERMRRLVDGKGAERIVAEMQASRFTLRRAEHRDCALLWEWANEPGVRQAAFCEDYISWAEHTAWFSRKMRDPRCVILIGEDDAGAPLGQMRVDFRSKAEGEIDVSLSASKRGSGYGSRLVDLGVRRIFSTTDLVQVHAFIRPQNTRSMLAFERAGFIKVGEELVKGHPAIHYSRTRDQ